MTTDKEPYSDRRWHEPFGEIISRGNTKLTPIEREQRREALMNFKKMFKKKYGKDLDITDLLKELDED